MLRAAPGRTSRQVSSYSIGLGVLCGILGLALTLSSPSTDWLGTAGLIMIHIAVCALVLASRLGNVAGAVLPDFLTVFLFFQLVSGLVSLLNLAIRASGRTVGTIAVGFGSLDDVTNSYRWQGECVFLCTTVLFVATWVMYERGRPLALWREPPPRVLAQLYLACTALYLLIFAMGAAGSVGAMGTVLYSCGLGAIAVLLSGRSTYALGRRGCWRPLAALLPYFILSLESGMKGAVATATLPILLPILLRPTKARLLFVIGLIFVALVFVFPFSAEWRKANWWGRQNETMSEVMSRVADHWRRDGIAETTFDGARALLARGSSSDIGGLVMHLADSRGQLGSVLIEGLYYVFVPRFLWPEKPQLRPGGWFTWYLGQARSPEAATTSTATMLGTEIYWMFGVPGLVIGVPAIALLFAWCWRQLLALSQVGPIPLVGLFVFLRGAMGLREMHTLYAIAEPVTAFVYLLGLHWMQRVLWPGLSTWSRDFAFADPRPGAMTAAATGEQSSAALPYGSGATGDARGLGP